MVSVIIAAHNEEAVLGACLDAVLGSTRIRPLEVIVTANGCTDHTAEIAISHSVVVIDRPEPGKAAALNAADAVASSGPRVYLDADIIPPNGAIDSLVAALTDTPGALVAVPARRVGTRGRSWPVRAYYRINERLPAFRSGLFGRGLIAVSEEGRARFATFPEMVADDLFLDSQFSDVEKKEVDEVEVVVEAPFTSRDLVKRLERVRRGNAEMRAAADRSDIETSVRPSDRWAWLRDVVLHDPARIPDAVPYVTITLVAALRSRRAARSTDSWGRDESTRAHQTTTVAPHP